VAVGADPARFEEEPGSFDVPDSVVGFLSGELGDPPGGWPEPFRSKALAGRTAKPQVTELTEDQRKGLAADRRLTLNALLFPGPTKDFLESRQRYGDISVLSTRDYLYGLTAGQEHQVDIEEGKTLILGLEAISEPDERGIRTVMCTINGQLRPVNVRDRGVAADAPVAEKADPSRPGQVGAPFGGVVTPLVAEGDAVEAGATVATIEAMKMEASITAPTGGTVTRVALAGPQQVEGGDLVLVIG
jgi:pyruvate carboxylase